MQGEGLHRDDQFLIDLCLWFAAAETRRGSKQWMWCGVRFAPVRPRKRSTVCSRIISPRRRSLRACRGGRPKDLLEASRHRAAWNAAAVRHLQAALMRADIPSLARKAVVYGRLFYGDWGLRGQADNDLFVPAAREAAAEVLRREGYCTGIWSGTARMRSRIGRSGSGTRERRSRTARTLASIRTGAKGRQFHGTSDPSS